MKNIICLSTILFISLFHIHSVNAQACQFITGKVLVDNLCTPANSDSLAKFATVKLLDTLDNEVLGVIDTVNEFGFYTLNVEGVGAGNYKLSVSKQGFISKEEDVHPLSAFLDDNFTILTLSLPPVKQEWVNTYSGSDSILNTATDVDIFGNIYVTGQSFNLSTNDDFVTIKYNKAGIQQWVATFNGTGNSFDRASAIVVDNDCNVYVTGVSAGSGTGADFATVKYDSNGVQQWVARFNGPANLTDEANAIALDVNKNIYVTGTSFGISTNLDYATVKYNNSGVQQWVARFNGSGNGIDKARDIGVDNSGNVYVTGEIFSSVGFVDYATIKYNTNGIQQWVATFNGSAGGLDKANAIAVDQAGDIFVTGQSLGSGTGFDYTTIHYNTNGVVQWTQRYDGPANLTDIANAIAIDDKNNVYVTGKSIGSGSSFDYATIKYNKTGTLKWIARFNGIGNGLDEAKAIAIDNEDNIYITGSSFNNSNFDFLTLKYNHNGEEQWHQLFNGTGNNYDMAFGIAVNGGGDVYVVGKSFNGNNYNFTTVKYAQCNSISSSGSLKTSYYDDEKKLAIVDAEQAAGNDLTIHPNPYTGKTRINYNLQEQTRVILEVFNVFGKRIKLITDNIQDEGYYTYQFSAGESGHQPGIYLVRLRLGLGDNIFTQRLVEFK